MKKLILTGLLVFSVMTGTVFAQNGIFTHKVGKFEVVTLPEVQQQVPANILINPGAEVLSKYVPNGEISNAVNCFVIKSPGMNILVDAGYGTNVEQNLKAAGLTPSEIDVVLLTHMHYDHIGGLLKNGSPAFPNAMLFIPSLEYNYWTDDKEVDKVPDEAVEMFNRARIVINAYKNQIMAFRPDNIGGAHSTVCPGVSGIAAYGHTPGHTMYLVESDNDKLLIWGDLTHAMAVQMPHPEISVTYDHNPSQAAASRKVVLEYVTKNNIPVAGMHISYPGTGKITKNSDGAYSFAPAK